MAGKSGVRSGRRQRTVKWATLVEHPAVRRLHPADFHAAMFVPIKGDRGAIITLSISAEGVVTEYCRPGADPNVNYDDKNAADWLAAVCWCAAHERAALLLSCDDAARAEHIAAAAAKMLALSHERVALERLYAGRAHRARLS